MTHATAAPAAPAPLPSATTRRNRLEWLMLAVVLVTLLGFLGWSRYLTHRQTVLDERARLATGAQAIEGSLARQLHGAWRALQGVREDYADAWRNPSPPERAVRRLASLSDAMPGVRTISMLDRDGRVLASNQVDLIGRSLADRGYFQQARANPQADRAQLSAPFLTAPGVYSLNLTAVQTGPGGRFEGIVTATLDPEYFRTLLRGALYADDMWAAIAHSGGQLVMNEPPNERTAGMNIDRPGSLFRRHRDSGQRATVLEGTTLATGDDRMMAQRTILPADVPLDSALVVAVSRRRSEVFAAWRVQTASYAAALALFAVAMALGLLALQRRQRALEQLQQEREALQRLGAERLELALRGADLGLWDLDVKSGRSAVNERWNSMLGLPHVALDAVGDVWRSRVHPDDWQRVISAQEAHLAGLTERFEAIYRLRHADGHWVWVLDRGQVTERDAQGAALRMVGTHMDISERMAAQQALAESEANLAITLHSIGDAVIATDARGAITRMNGAAQRLTGWEQVDAIGHPLGDVFRIFNARTREPAQDPVQQVLAHGEIVGLANDTLLVARDGREYQIADSAAPIRAAGGAIVGVVLTFSDVTERYRAEQALRANEQRLRSLLDHISAGVIVHAADTRILDANPAACRITGLSLAQMQGKVSIDPAWAFLEEDHTPMAHERFPVPQVLARRAPLTNFLVGMRRPELPRPVWALCNAYPLFDADGQVEQVVVTFADITERKEAEEELRLLGAAVAGLNDVVLITEAEPLAEPGPPIVFANEAFERITGWRREEVLGRSPRLLQGPLTDRAELARIGAALRRGEPVHAELVNYRRDGAAYWVEIDILPLRDAQGRISHRVSVQRDITERRQAQQRMLEAQAELQATLEAVPDLLFDMDIDGYFRGFHSPRHDLLYVPPEHFLGRTLEQVLPPDVAGTIRQALHQAAETGVSIGLQYELPLPDGRHWFELSVSRKPPPPDGPTRFIVLARDVTQRVQAERDREALQSQLREAQKMESIGTLAGGIAHDFNNILAAILGNVGLAREDAGPGHPVQASLEQIHRAGLRARQLVQQILAFSRRESTGLKAQPLGPIVQESLDLLRATLPAGVALQSRLSGEPLAVNVDATQVQQVIVNLCTNAWHALPERGGLIEVGVERLEMNPALSARMPESTTGACAHLWVRDNGCGMDAATRERIFDPFFTTKPVGQGTGLGLSVVHGIVRAHRGTIAVDSAPGQGSTFHLHFPLAEGEAVAGEGLPDTNLRARGHGQRVLYVDDDEVMAIMVERLLQRAGFEAASERDAALALARVRDAQPPFDVVVTDFNMPDMSGLEVAAALQGAMPGLPVIITTGFVSDTLREQSAAVGVRALLMKERTLEELAGLILDVLASR